MCKIISPDTTEYVRLTLLDIMNGETMKTILPIVIICSFLTLIMCSDTMVSDIYYYYIMTVYGRMVWLLWFRIGLKPWEVRF